MYMPLCDKGLISCRLILYHFRLLEELGHRSDCNGAQAMKFLQGLVLAINCTAETPMFLYSGTKLITNLSMSFYFFQCK